MEHHSLLARSFGMELGLRKEDRTRASPRSNTSRGKVSSRCADSKTVSSDFEACFEQFDALDVDGSGTLEPLELLPVIQAICQTQVGARSWG